MQDKVGQYGNDDWKSVEEKRSPDEPKEIFETLFVSFIAYDYN